MSDYRLTLFEQAPRVPFKLDGRKLFSSADFEMVHLTLQPGEGLAPHAQPIDVVFFVVQGAGTLTVGDENLEIPENTTIHVKSGILRAWTNTGKLPLRILVNKLIYTTGSSGMMIQAMI